MSLIHIFRADDEKYKGYDLPHKILSDMIAEMAESKFSSSASHIITKRFWESGAKEMDPNDILRVKEFNNDMSKATHTYMTLKRLYETTFGEMSKEMLDNISTIADEYANIALKKCGWIKEEDNGNN